MKTIKNDSTIAEIMSELSERIEEHAFDGGSCLNCGIDDDEWVREVVEYTLTRQRESDIQAFEEMLVDERVMLPRGAWGLSGAYWKNQLRAELRQKLKEME